MYNTPFIHKKKKSPNSYYHFESIAWSRRPGQVSCTLKIKGIWLCAFEIGASRKRIISMEIISMDSSWEATALSTYSCFSVLLPSLKVMLKFHVCFTKRQTRFLRSAIKKCIESRFLIELLTLYTHTHTHTSFTVIVAKSVTKHEIVQS